MIKNLFVILAFVAISFTSCTKSELSLPPPLTAASYFPQTNGSSWTYRDSIYGQPTDTALAIYGPKFYNLVFTMNGDSTNFNGQLCYNASISAVVDGPGASIAYYYAYKHKCTLYQTMAPFGLTGLDVLVDTASAGYTWTSVPTLNRLLKGNPVRTINTIMEKNITKIISGVTYNNVTHTSINFQVNDNGTGFHNIALYDFYVAQGIGVIEKDAYVYGSYNEVMTIANYSIK
jgi:hypothetical protein